MRDIGRRWLRSRIRRSDPNCDDCQSTIASAVLEYVHQVDSLLRLLSARTTAVVFAQRSSAAIVCRVASILLWFALQALLVRKVGLPVYGEFVFVLALATSLGEIGALGFDKVVLRYAAKYDEQKQFADLFGVVWHSLRISCVASFFTCAALFCGVWLLDTSIDPGVASCIWLAAMIVPIVAVTIVSEATLRARGRIVKGLLSTLIIPTGIFLTVLCLPTISLGDGHSANIMTLHLGMALLAMLVAVGLVARERQLLSTAQTSFDDSPQWNSTAIPMFLLTLQSAVQCQCGILLCGTLLGNTQAGLFGLMVRMSALLGFGLQTINLVAAPMFAQLHTSGKGPQMQNLARMCAWISTLFSVLAGGGILLCWQSIERLFGTSLNAGYPSLMILLFGAVMNATAGSVGYLLLMSGNHVICVKVLSAGAAVSLLLSAILIPPFGMIGAATANAMATTSWNIALVYVVYRRLHIWSFVGPVSLAV